MRRFLLVAALLGGPAAADEVRLEDGGRIPCEVLRETAAYVLVRLPHGTMRIPRAKVAEVVHEGRTAYLAREAASSLKAGSTATAVEMYDRALAEEPDNADLRDGLEQALLAHAEALARAYRFPEARAALDRIDPEHPRARAIREAIAAEENAASRSFRAAVRAMDGGDFPAGLRLLEAWRLRRPAGDEAARNTMADAYLAAAQRALRDGVVRSALDHYRAAASFGARGKAEEPLRLLRPVAILEALKGGEIDEARRLIDSISTTYPDPSVPVFLKAVLAHVRGDVEDAVRDYSEAARLAEKHGEPERGLPYELVRAYAVVTMRASIARPPQEGVAKWRETFLGPLEREESEHFVVYAPTSRQARETGAAADRMYAAIATDLLGSVPEAERAEIVVHASRQAYLAADQIPDKSPWAAVFLPREKTGGVCYDTLDAESRPLIRIEVPAGGANLLADTLPHEIVHVLQRRGLPAFRRGHWFDEGLAMMYESQRGQKSRLDRLKKSGDPMPLPELLALRSTPPDRVGIFYDQSFALATYLFSSGDPEDWRDFLKAYAAMSFEDAVAETYGIDSLERLERGFLAAFRS